MILGDLVYLEIGPFSWLICRVMKEVLRVLSPLDALKQIFFTVLIRFLSCLGS